ncbi:MAG: hypothetical protein K0Q74_1217 [Gammaproteobacteria bacterium]|nr:hypothetical protein [Gammaproteobacteria bacterium]
MAKLSRVLNIFINNKLVGLIPFLAIILLPYQALAASPTQTHLYKIIQTLEIVDTPETMERGLMWRKDLCDYCGMLFIFKPEQIVSMWMKNTVISLDMIFINHKGTIVEIHKNTTPFQTSPVYTSHEKVTCVLEVKAGFVERERLKVGMHTDMAMCQ